MQSGISAPRCRTNDDCVAADFWLWKEIAPYRQPNDWLFTSPRIQGKHPFWPDALPHKIIRPAALRAGINKKIGWHNFPHTSSTLPIADGENLKVVQELMRHGGSRCTLEVYSQARILVKRQAQQLVVQMILPKEADPREPVLAYESETDIR